MKALSERITPLQSDSKKKSLLSHQQVYEILNALPKLNGHQTPQEVFCFLKSILDHVYFHLNKTNIYTDEHLWNLSARELLSYKDVFYMNACLEYSLVTLQYMKQIGFDSTRLIIDELDTAFPNVYRLHFGIEGTHLGKTYFVDHISKNTVYIGQGNFVSQYKDTTGEESINSISLDGNAISVDDSFPDLHQKGLIKFKYFSLQSLELFKKKFQQDNTPEQRKKGFINKIGGKGNIDKPSIIVIQNQNPL